MQPAPCTHAPQSLTEVTAFPLFQLQPRLIPGGTHNGFNQVLRVDVEWSEAELSLFELS